MEQMTGSISPQASKRAPGKHAVRAQLDRITGSTDFDDSRRTRDFLRFVVEETLAGHADCISQHAIATEVFGRGNAFDPNTDPIVRMQAGRVRRSLEHYYLTAGGGDPVLIALPKGTYAPIFALRQPAGGGASASAESAPEADRTDAWPTLLISPFRNLTGREDVDCIAQGLASDMAAELSHYTDLHVFLSPDPAPTAHQAFPARFKLTGTVASRGDELKINVHLVDGAGGQQVWANDYRCPEGTGRGAALDEGVQSTVAMLAEEHGIISSRCIEGIGQRPRAASGAYEAILHYLHFEHKQTPELFAQALVALRRAVEEFPECALCWSYLARLGAVHWSVSLPGEPVPIADSIAAARRGVDLNPADLRARLVLGYVLLLDDQVDQARRETEIALRLSRGSIFWLDAIGYLLALSGDWERGPDLVRQAVAANPFHRRLCHGALWLEGLRGNNPDAALAAAREYIPKTNFWSPLMQAVALASGNRMDEASREVKRLLQFRPDFPERGRWLITRYVKFGDLVDIITEALATCGLRVD